MRIARSDEDLQQSFTTQLADAAGTEESSRGQQKVSWFQLGFAEVFSQLRIEITTFFAKMIILAVGCGPSPDDARKEIVAMTGGYSTDGFIAAVKGNDLR